MSANYVSARFEKTDLSSALGKVRCIVRNLFDGPVPPSPSSSYFPTQPIDLREFFVIEYVNDVIGERLVRVAALDDITTYGVQQLTVFEDLTADFVSAGVIVGDTLTVYPSVPEEWTSEEYPGASRRFVVTSILSATRITVQTPFPSFKAGISWAITSRGISGAYTGTTRRSGLPVPLDRFRDRRMNFLFGSIPEMDAFVLATKANLDALAQASTSSTLSSESYTSQV